MLLECVLFRQSRNEYTQEMCRFRYYTFIYIVIHDSFDAHLSFLRANKCLDVLKAN